MDLLFVHSRRFPQGGQNGQGIDVGSAPKAACPPRGVDPGCNPRVEETRILRADASWLSEVLAWPIRLRQGTRISPRLVKGADRGVLEEPRGQASRNAKSGEPEASPRMHHSTTGGVLRERPCHPQPQA